MKGVIVDFNNSESFISLDDGSILTLPLSSFNHPVKIGDNINLSSLYTPSNHNAKNFNDLGGMW